MAKALVERYENYAINIRTNLSESQFDGQTLTFESGSDVHWDESEDSLQGCMNDIGSSNILIDCEED